MHTEEYICAQCSRVYPTCCQLGPGNERPCFPLSPRETDNLQKHLQSDEFLVRETTSQELVQGMIHLLPEHKSKIKSIFAPGTCHLRLKTLSNGKCVLLSEHGCVLPESLRPVYCKLYPFWFYGRRLTYLADDNCLAQHKAGNIRSLLKLFGAKPEELKRDFQAMLRGLGLEHD